MKLGLKIGDTVEVTAGKLAGQKSKIAKIDKRSERVVLEGLKKQKVKTKDSKTKELHGSFHVKNIKLVKEAPKQEKAEEAQASPAAAPEAAQN